MIWDMKQRKMWCEIKDPAGGAISDIAWGPDGGTNIITASGDDRNPVLKYWDLRSSTSLPLATLKGHTEGILSVDWCPNDPYLLMSCGKDNKTIIWDLLHLQAVHEFPAEPTSSPSRDSMAAGAALFGGMAAQGGQRRYQASWSPHLPAVAAHLLAAVEHLQRMEGGHLLGEEHQLELAHQKAHLLELAHRQVQVRHLVHQQEQVHQMVHRLAQVHHLVPVRH